MTDEIKVNVINGYENADEFKKNFHFSMRKNFGIKITFE